MGKNWRAVAEAVNTRMDELGMTQTDLVRESRVATMTVQTIRRGVDKTRSPHTLAAISRALRWPSDHLERIANGDDVDAGNERDGGRISRLESEVADLLERVERLESDR